MWASTIIFLLGCPIAWAWRDSLSFPAKSSGLWHTLGFWLRAFPAVLLLNDSLLFIAYAFYFWIVFEIAINLFCKKDIFYLDKSTLLGELLHSFYLTGKVIAVIKLILMFVFLTIKLI